MCYHHEENKNEKLIKKISKVIELLFDKIRFSKIRFSLLLFIKQDFFKNNQFIFFYLHL